MILTVINNLYYSTQIYCVKRQRKINTKNNKASKIRVLILGNLSSGQWINTYQHVKNGCIFPRHYCFIFYRWTIIYSRVHLVTLWYLLIYLPSVAHNWTSLLKKWPRIIFCFYWMKNHSIWVLFVHLPARFKLWTNPFFNTFNKFVRDIQHLYQYVTLDSFFMVRLVTSMNLF